MLNLNSRKNKRGFTLIELLVVVAIISLLSSVVLASLNSARAKARDARRLSDMKQIQTALQFYYDKYGTWPNANSDSGATACGGWDTSADNNFLGVLVTEGWLPTSINDPINTFSGCAGSIYRYYHYPAVISGWYACPKSFYVLQITDIESSSGVSPLSPGWSCGGSGSSWATEWSTGEYD